MAEQKYRYLQEGDAITFHTQWRCHFCGEISFHSGSLLDFIVGNKISRNMLKMFEFRVPITEESKMCDCEIVLSEEIAYLKKDTNFNCTDSYNKNGKCIASTSLYKPSDFASTPIGTIWDNVNGKPVRRPTVEKCAVCGNPPSVYHEKVMCHTVDCQNDEQKDVEDWNNEQRKVNNLLKKAGWVRV